MSQPNSLRSILFALAANFSIFLAKITAALITGSGAMLAEAIHSLADSGNQLLLLLGLKRAKRPPNDEYPLGFGKTIYFWSFIVALMMFSMGGMFSVYEGIHKLYHPEPLSAPWLALIVLLFSIGAEGVSMWGCLQEVNKVRGERNYFTWFRESRQSELLVVFGEDLAALVGLSMAFFAVLLSMITGNPVFDAMGSVIIGLLLLVIAVMIGVEVKSLLIGQSVEPALRKELVELIEAQPGVVSVYNVITMQLGSDVMLAVKAKMEQHADQGELIAAINACEQEIQTQFPQVVWCFFEPDNAD